MNSELCHILTSPLPTPHSQLCGDLNIQQPQSLWKPGGWRPMEGARQGGAVSEPHSQRDAFMWHDLELIPWKYPFLRGVFEENNQRQLFKVSAACGGGEKLEQTIGRQETVGNRRPHGLWALICFWASRRWCACRPWAFSLGWPWGSVREGKVKPGRVSWRLAGWAWETCSNRHPEAPGKHEGLSCQVFGKVSVQSLGGHEGNTGETLQWQHMIYTDLIIFGKVTKPK